MQHSCMHFAVEAVIDRTVNTLGPVQPVHSHSSSSTCGKLQFWAAGLLGSMHLVYDVAHDHAVKTSESN